jgi:hypothetical protein
MLDAVSHHARTNYRPLVPLPARDGGQGSGATPTGMHGPKPRCRGIEVVSAGCVTNLTLGSPAASQHLGYDKRKPVGRTRGSSRNGKRSKTALTVVAGEVDIEVTRDRNGCLGRLGGVRGPRTSQRVTNATTHTTPTSGGLPRGPGFRGRPARTAVDEVAT